MRKLAIVAFALILFLFSSSAVFSQGLLYFGLQAGFSAQKPSLEGVEFNTDTKFLYGLRAGVRFLMVALEANYFQAAHNLELNDFFLLHWQGRQVDYSYVGLNLKYIFSLLMVHPYLTFGYGYYTADIHEIDKDSDGGFNFGAGLEFMLGKKFSFLAEGRYHHTRLDIQKRDLGLGDFTFCGGFNIYF